MAVAPLTFYDGFSRALSNTWGTSDSGHTWLNTNDDYDSFTSGDFGRITVPAGRGAHVVEVDVPNNGSQEVVYKVRWNTDNLTDHGPVIRKNGNSYYFLRIFDFWNEIAMSVCIDGVFYEIDRVGITDFTLSKDTYYWVKLRSSSNLQAKIWPAGSAEPAGWTLTTSHWTGANPPGAGDFGYFTRGTSATYSVYIDTAYWYSLEDTEAGLPVTDTFSRTHGRGWGMSDTGQMWEGNLSDDPAFYALSGEGSVVSSGGGYGRVDVDLSATSRNGIIGPVVANSDVLAKVYVSSVTGSPETFVCIRAAATPSSGSLQFTGYYARLIWGSTTFSIRKITTPGGSSSQVGSNFTLGAAPAAGQQWNVRIQATGTTIRARAWLDGTAEPGTWQVSGTDSSLTSGRSMVRFVGNVSNSYQFRVYDFVHTVIAGSTILTVGTLAVNTVTDTSFNISASYTNDTDNDSSCTIQYRKLGDDSWISPTVSVNRTTKIFSASATGLTQGTIYEVKATYADPDGVTGTNPRTILASTALNGIDITDFTVSALATTADVAFTYQNDADQDSSATVRYRLAPAGTWSSNVSMDVDRPSKTFSKQISGLAADTSYEIEVTVTDSDGVRGSFTTKTVTTLGVGAIFAATPITATPQDTSAILNVYYELDTNNNCEIALQIRAINETLWTTINPSVIQVSREDKQFRAIVAGLKPNLSYIVQAFLSDPDGLSLGSSSEATTVFTTLGTVVDPDLRGKHYLYKVYSPDDVYLGTWADAPEPSFDYHQNGGVGDLNVVLPRTLASLNSETTLDFGNRVEIWAIDATSRGLGPNLVTDWDMELGSWTTGDGWTVSNTGGPDGGKAMYFSSESHSQKYTLSETIEIDDVVPLVLKAVAKARGGKLRFDIAAYDEDNDLLDSADHHAETVGPDWQEILMTWTPPPATAYVRVRVSNIRKGNMWFDKVQIHQKEMLIYQGYIESYTPKVTEQGEEVEVEVLGPVAQLNDVYVEFMQFVDVQPSKDIAEHPNENRPPDDPGNIMKKLIDFARKENPRCKIWYDDTSIRLTGSTVEYTFRNMQLHDAIDKLRTLCPPGWHWYIDSRQKAYLQGPEHVQNHRIRLGVEVIEFSNERSIRNLKNYITVTGRQDSDGSEPDGYGSIVYHAFDQASIDRYGKRMLYIRDSNVKDPATAEIMGEGRLEEHNVVEEAGRVKIPDEKDLYYTGGALRGYNIESVKPGDMVKIYDPVSGGARTYWDQFFWDSDGWDDHGNRVLPTSVPVKTIQYRGDHVVLELSERQPSASGNFAKLSRWLRLVDTDGG